MDPKDVYAAAGYKGLDIILPAVETFVQSLASGHTPDELHALYPAPTEQKFSKAQQLYGNRHKHKQQSSSGSARQTSPAKTRAQQTQDTRQRAPPMVILLEEASLTLPQALRAVHIDHAIPIAAVDTGPINCLPRITSSRRTPSPGRVGREHVQSHHSQLPDAEFSSTRTEQPVHDLLFDSHDDQTESDPSSSFASQFCSELADLSASSTNSWLQHQAEQGYGSAVQQLDATTLEQLKEAVQHSKQPVQHHGHTWQLDARSAEPVWHLLQQLPFLDRLAPGLGPAVCLTILLQRLPAGSQLLPRQTASSSGLQHLDSSACSLLHPVLILLSGELQCTPGGDTGFTSIANDSRQVSQMLSPGAVLNCHRILGLAGTPVTGTSSSSDTSGNQQTKKPQEELTSVTVGQRLAAEVLLLEPEAVLAAVRWWGAASLNWQVQLAVSTRSGADTDTSIQTWSAGSHQVEAFVRDGAGVSVGQAAAEGRLYELKLPGGRSCFITQSQVPRSQLSTVASIPPSNSVVSQSCGVPQQHGSSTPVEDSNNAVDSAAAACDANQAAAASSQATASHGNTDAPITTTTPTSITSDAAGTSTTESSSMYSKLLSAWRLLPVRLQQQLLQCCRCRMLPAGRLAAPAITAAEASKDSWCLLACGTVLKVQRQLPSAAGELLEAADAAANAISQSAALPGPPVNDSLRSKRSSRGCTPATGPSATFSAIGRSSIAVQSSMGPNDVARTTGTTADGDTQGRWMLNAAASARARGDVKDGDSQTASLGRRSTTKWNHGSPAAGTAGRQQQQLNLRTSTFKALGAQEQWQQLAQWSQLEILQQYNAGQQLMTTSPAAAPTAVAQSHLQETAEPLQADDVLLVTAEPCLMAAMTRVECGQAVAVIMHHLQQQWQQYQGKGLEHIQHVYQKTAQQPVSGACQHVTAAVSAPVAATLPPAAAGVAAAAGSVAADSSAATDSNAAADSNASEDSSAATDSNLAADSNAAALSNPIADSNAATDSNVAANSIAVSDSSAATDSTVAANSTAASDSNAATDRNVAANSIAATDSIAATESNVTVESKVVAESNASADGNAGANSSAGADGNAGTNSSAATDMHAILHCNAIAFLARFVDAVEELCQQEYSQGQLQQQRHEDPSPEQRNLAVALTNLGVTAPTPLHDGSASSRGVPKLQVHTVQSLPSRDTRAAATGMTAAAGETPASLTVAQRIRKVPAAASGDDLPSDRQAWLKSEVYDPFGLLQPQLKAHTVEQQRLLSGRLVNHQANPSAVPTGSAYYSLSAASNQRHLGAFTMPGKLQMQGQGEAARQQQHQQSLLGTTSSADISSSNTVKGSGAVSSTNAVGKQLLPLEAMHQQQKHHASDISQLLRGASTDDDNDESDGLIATRGKPYKGTSCSWKIEHQRWNVPAYNSETGYVGGLYDESTGTMYIN